MADRYWVGGSGNWDASSTANWSDSSGGSSGASAPTSADNVIFDAASNTGTGAFTVTVTGTSSAPAACADFSTGGAGGALDGAMTLLLGATAALDIYGSMTLPATNFTWSGTAGSELTFRATTTGKTVTTNGVSIQTTGTNFNGAGGGWTLGSAYTGVQIRVQQGTFNTGNFNITGTLFNTVSTNTRTVTLGSSTCTFTGSGPFDASTTTGLTFNAGTSTITCSAASPIFTGGGLTFYNVTFSSTAAGTVTMTGANTFNNLTQSTIAAVGIKVFSLGASITVNGTLTLNNGTLGGARVVFRSSSASNIRTVTVATLATTADVDFYNIAAAGASIPWSGTRLGNCAGNSNITFVAGVNKYWNLAAGGNWNSTAWALASGGAVAAINYPLPQDTAIIENTGLNTGATITMNVNAYIGSLDCSGRTNAFNWTQGNSDPQIFGSTFKLSSAMTMTTVTGSPTFNFSGRNITQTFDSAGIQVRLDELNINVVGGTLLLAGNTTVDLTNGSGYVSLNLGTLDLAGYTLTTVAFASNNSDTRSIAFGTGNITITGNNLTVWGCSTLTNFSYTGTPTVNFNYSGSTGTRAIGNGSSGGTETNAVSMNISAGTDIIAFSANSVFKNLSYTGFAGTSNLSGGNIYGNLTLATGMTISASSANGAVFAATSGTQTITSNGVTINRPVTINAPGAIVQCQDALTLGSTRTLTMTNGTLQLKAGVTSTVGGFATSGTNQKYLQSTLAGTQATLSCASGTISVSYLTIQDIDATGGATWNAYLYNANVDAGNNTNWNFQGGPGIGGRGLLPAFGFGFTL